MTHERMTQMANILNNTATMLTNDTSMELKIEALIRIGGIAKFLASQLQQESLVNDQSIIDNLT